MCYEIDLPGWQRHFNGILCKLWLEAIHRPSIMVLVWVLITENVILGDRTTKKLATIDLFLLWRQHTQKKLVQETRAGHLVQESCTFVGQPSTILFWCKFLASNYARLYSSTETVPHGTLIVLRDWPASYYRYVVISFQSFIIFLACSQRS